MYLPHKLNNTACMERGDYWAHKEENECYFLSSNSLVAKSQPQCFN